MGGRFDDDWVDNSDGVENAEDEFAPVDPFEGINKREQDLFFRMLDIIPEDKREEAMDYFVEHPRKIQEVISVMKAKRKIVEAKDLTGLRTVFDDLRVNFEDNEIYPADLDESTAATGVEDENY